MEGKEARAALFTAMAAASLAMPPPDYVVYNGQTYRPRERKRGHESIDDVLERARKNEPAWPQRGRRNG